jgi:peptidoglycan/LPS O-acetylase OafA/YrhL
MKDRNSGDARVPELDGVRAIAIWMVLLVHCLFSFPNPPGALAFAPKIVLGVLSHGWLGVDLFFMLSGFLITGILLGSKKNPHYFRNFYVRRVLRIMPLYFVVVIVWSLLYRGYGKFFLLSSVFGANLSFLLYIAEPHGPGVLWSLAVEEHFYLFWPLLVFLLNRRSLVILVSLLIVGTPILRWYYAAHGMDPELIYMLTWFRLDGLASGALIAMWARSTYATRRNSLYLCASLLTAAAVLTALGLPFGIMGSKTPVSIALRTTQAYLVFGSVFVLIVMYRDTIWTAPLRWRFMQLSGALSYCLYLVHLSIGDGYQYLLTRSGISLTNYLGASGTVLFRATAVIAASFAVAAVSRKYLEEPCLALKSRFTESGPLKTPVRPAKEEAVASV